jgi:hypothetical protein
LALVIGVIAYAAIASQKEKPNPETNCYKHISGKMAILIDKTDIIPPQTQTEIASRALAAINEHSKMGDLISVYEITQDSLSSLKPSFQMCRPKSGNESSELTENSKKIDKTFKEKFEKPLTLIFCRLIQDKHKIARLPKRHGY